MLAPVKVAAPLKLLFDALRLAANPSYPPTKVLPWLSSSSASSSKRYGFSREAFSNDVNLLSDVPLCPELRPKLLNSCFCIVT
jgi:hypothetical protein